MEIISQKDDHHRKIDYNLSLNKNTVTLEVKAFETKTTKITGNVRGAEKTIIAT